MLRLCLVTAVRRRGNFSFFLLFQFKKRPITMTLTSQLKTGEAQQASHIDEMVVCVCVCACNPRRPSIRRFQATNGDFYRYLSYGGPSITCVCARALGLMGGGSGRLLDFTNDLLGYIVMICGSVCVKHGKRKNQTNKKRGRANKKKKGHGDFFSPKRKEGKVPKKRGLFYYGSRGKNVKPAARDL